MEYDFNQDELYFPVTLTPELTKLLETLPRTLDPNREDVQTLVKLGFATPIQHKRFISFKRTEAGDHQLGIKLNSDGVYTREGH